MCLFSTNFLCVVNGAYIIFFSYTIHLYAEVSSCEHFGKNVLEIDLVPTASVDMEGNVYLGITDLNEAFYLRLLYRNNPNVSLKRFKTQAGFYIYGIYLNTPVRLSSCY